jgi:pimeloyl-ACP methyl ester carboxylesterase
MPTVQANNIAINYEQQGSGEPLILIPYLAADNACYAFQVADYAKHCTCISLDLRGTGLSDKPAGQYSTELFADDVAAFMQALGIQRAHITGLSLGAAVGMHLAARHPDKVKSLSLHSAWIKLDLFGKTVLEGWQVMAKALNSVPETMIRAMFPWCFTPDLYHARPDYIGALADFVRSRPAQPVANYLQHTDAVLRHNAEAVLASITAPTQITVGRFDMVTPVRAANDIKQGIRNSELIVFESSSHAQIYEQTEEFNRRTLEFLQRQRAAAHAA